MKLLAFDTSTENLSVAVQAAAGGPVHALDAPGGAQASATLIPSIHRLLAEAGLTLAELDAIVFGRGPGSFTGLRTACSVAQGLAFGADVSALPVETLMAVAQQARSRIAASQVVAVLDARMDEVYWAAYRFDDGLWSRKGEIHLSAPQEVEVPPGFALAGNALDLHRDRLPQTRERVIASPDARSMLELAPAWLARGGAVDAAHALPLYIRDKVAQTTEERAAARARANSTL